jgi:hypothetical protein
VQVQVILSPARGSAHADRRALAQRLHDDIAQALHGPTEMPAASVAAPTV